MANWNVFVTQPVDPKAQAELSKVGKVNVFPDSSRVIDRDSLLAGIKDADILYCLLHDKIDRTVIEAAPNLKMIANSAIGPANIDVQAASERNIAVTGIPNIVAETTADLQFGIMLAIARRIVEGDKALRRGIYPGSQSTHLVGGEVHGKIVGSVGLGEIGKGLARRARGFDMKVIYTKRHRLSEDEEKELGVEYCSFEDLMRRSDFVCVNAALNEQTRHMVDAQALALMKPTAYLVNTSRGPIVDEQALVDALGAKRIAGAALDVYENEPKVHPALLDMENAVLTPHLGSAAADTRARLHAVVLDNIKAFINGERPPNLCNPEGWHQ